MAAREDGQMSVAVQCGHPRAVRYCALAAVIMAYGWGYRGTVGHEQGAMVPAALLGLVLCLGAGRVDWHRRAVVVGFCAAVGWAWGGSISYMEQTFYVLSDSFYDVLYGYTMLFFIGALWAGCGGAILGLGLTEPRSDLEGLTRPFIWLGLVYLLGYLYLACVPEHNEAYETFTVHHFHDGDWLSATLAFMVAALYAVVRPKDRRGALLIMSAALAWWIGYGLLTKLGGLRLAPLHRSESWGGVLGVLIALVIFLVRRRNWAALMLSLYGTVGGGLAFALAVFVHNLLVTRWGPFAQVQLPLCAWRLTEVTFGGLMGFALALGTLRLLRGGIAPAAEDCDRSRLDALAAFVITIGLFWMNFRRHTERVLNRLASSEENTLLGLSTGVWYCIAALLATAPALYALYRYRRGDRGLFPRSAFGKGAGVTLLILSATAAAQLLDGYPTRISLIGNLCIWLPAAMAACLIMSFSPDEAQTIARTETGVSRENECWRVGRRYAFVCALVPAVLLAITGLSTANQEGIFGDRGRLRFGPNAYWRQTARLIGSWNVVGRANEVGADAQWTENLSLSQLEFDAQRNTVATLPGGKRVESHRWFLKNQYIWLQWFSKLTGHAERAEVPLQFRKQRLYIAWPPHRPREYLVLERDEGGAANPVLP